MHLAIPRRRIFGYPGMFKDCFKLFIHSRVIGGGWVTEFEDKFAQYIGTRYAIAVSSGRMGLALILRALGLKNPAEVTVPVYTDLSVSSTIVKLGLKPIFVDITPEDHNIDPDKLERKISKKTKVIIATHLLGRPCALDRILEIAQKHNLIVVEDCAHSIGAEYLIQIRNPKSEIRNQQWKRVGGFGRAAFFSFSATKTLNTFGGGMITTDSQELAEKIRSKIDKFSYPDQLTVLKKVAFTFILYLLTLPPIFTFTGFLAIRWLAFFQYDILDVYNRTIKRPIKSEYKNLKFTNLQAFVGLRQLANIDLINRRHIANARLLRELLNKRVRILKDEPLSQPTYYFFVIESERKEFLAQNLLKKGIDTGEKIMRNCARIVEAKENFPITEQAIKDSLQIPIHFPLGKEAITYIAKAINEYS